MKNKLALALIWIFLFLTTVPHSVPVQGQIHSRNQSKEQITGEEIKQVQEMSERFIQRFRETRDLTPIVNEIFTNNFKKKIENDTTWSGMVGQGRSLTEQLDAKQRLRCFIVGFNLQYLMRLYLAGKFSLDSKNSSLSDELLPAKITRFLKDQAPADEEIKSTIQANNYLAFLEQAVILMQEEVRQNPPEITDQFKKNLSAFDAHLNQYPEEKPSVRVFVKKQHGLSAGTRLIRMVIPFHVGLLMVKEGRALKLEGVATNLPPD